jgi:hypothetical protein
LPQREARRETWFLYIMGAAIGALLAIAFIGYLTGAWNPSP